MFIFIWTKAFRQSIRAPEKVGDSPIADGRSRYGSQSDINGSARPSMIIPLAAIRIASEKRPRQHLVTSIPTGWPNARRTAGRGCIYRRLVAEKHSNDR